jgi:hypothetical protein
VLYSPTGEYNKTAIFKMAPIAVLWKLLIKKISEIKTNSDPKSTKDLCKNTKTIIRLRLGDYRVLRQRVTL